MPAKTHVMHGRDHLPAGADPIPYPPGILVGTSGLDLAYQAPGSLLWLYRMGDLFAFPASGQETTPALLDTSGFDATQRNMTYHEENTRAGWAAGNRPTLDLLDHAALGDADDGCVQFKRLAGFFSPSTSAAVPGAAFYHLMEAPVSLGWAVAANDVQTAMCWFKPDPAEDRTQPAGAQKQVMIHGNWAGTQGGGNAAGWGTFFNYFSDQFQFAVQSGSTVVLNLLGPAGIIYGNWYHVAVTWDGTTATLYHNAVPVASLAWAGAAGGQTLRIGGTLNKNVAGYDYMAGGEIDDCAGFDSCLTQAQIAAIYSATGSSSDIAGVSGITVGDPAVTATAISSTQAGVNVPAHQIVASKGDGTTTYEYPTHGVYVGGS